MKLTIPTECPRCEAFQEFAPKQRRLDQNSDVIEIYINCKTCRYRKVIRRSTPEIERLREAKAVLARRMSNYVSERTLIPSTLSDKYMETNDTLVQLQKELDNASE